MLPDRHSWFPPILFGAFTAVAAAIVLGFLYDQPAAGLAVGAAGAVGWWLLGRVVLARGRLRWAFEPTGSQVVTAVVLALLPWALLAVDGPPEVSFALMWPVLGSLWLGVERDVGIGAIMLSPVVGTLYVLGVAAVVTALVGRGWSAIRAGRESAQ